MSPARTIGDDIDLDKLLRRIILDLHLFRFFAVNGRGLAALSAIQAARITSTGGDAPILAWIESWVTDGIAGPPPNGPPPPDAA